MIHAPEFSIKSTWLNVERPVSLKELRGHVILLDFWTYCCINCMHVLPVLEKLEKEFAEQPFHVIGVHAAKFDEEKDAVNISEAMARHGIKHPVLVDSDHDIWVEYAIRAWPSLVLINGEGHIVDQFSGEPTYGELSKKIREVLETDKSAGKLAGKKLEFSKSSNPDSSFLYYPGKVRFFTRSKTDPLYTIIISDTGHHRIIYCKASRDTDGWPHIESMEIIGGGGIGQQDGNYSTASFRRPQGMDKRGSTLYICDTENYLLRAVDLEEKKVTTIAGNGERSGKPTIPGPLGIPLRSPWDCLAYDSAILMAMAGCHQLWVYDLIKQDVFPVVGSGYEDHVDGTFEESALAQPSSFFQIGNNVLFADSETSSLRVADFEKRAVMTIMGQGLFDFGDVDGDIETARLQHPLGAILHNKSVYVADTFNNKIKKIDLDNQICSTFLGDGNPEILHEPGGLDMYDGFLFIPDTNNHRIQIAKIDLKEIRTLELK